MGEGLFKGENESPDDKPKQDNEIERDDDGVELRVPKHGKGRLRRGNPHAPGRPPLSWQEKCRRLATRKSSLRAVKQILSNPDHEAFPTVYKFVAEQAYGKAVARHVIRDESPAKADELAKALTVALSDPGVRAWLERERPEVMDGLAGAAGSGEVRLIPIEARIISEHPLNPANLLQAGDDSGDDEDDDDDESETL